VSGFRNGGAIDGLTPCSMAMAVQATTAPAVGAPGIPSFRQGPRHLPVMFPRMA